MKKKKKVKPLHAGGRRKVRWTGLINGFVFLISHNSLLLGAVVRGRRSDLKSYAPTQRQQVALKLPRSVRDRSMLRRVQYSIGRKRKRKRFEKPINLSNDTEKKKKKTYRSIYSDLIVVNNVSVYR